MSLMLALCMVFGMIPIAAFADDANHTDHCYCGGDVTTDGHTHNTALTWTAWDKVDSLPTAKGSYYLVTDVTMNSGVTVKEDVSLCLNGHKITQNNPDVEITIFVSGCKFNLSDCEETGVITGKSVAMCAGNSAELNMYGGEISDISNIKMPNGCGISAGTKATVNINGGKIINNTANMNGGGVYIYNATLNMNGGEISGNKAGRNGLGGGVYATNGSTVNINGGEVRDNSADISGRGGGIAVYQGSILNINGGEITDNSADILGGGIAVNNSTANIKGGKISNNITMEIGGGIHAFQSTVDITGGEISKNTAKGDGGGVYAEYGSTVNIMGGKISDNTATARGGGIYAFGGSYEAKISTVTVTGGEVRGNRADNGGGIYGDVRSVLNINGGSIGSNTADFAGGGVYTTGLVNVNGGKISENKSRKRGAGIFAVNSSATVNVNDGEIIDNDADIAGGGVFATGGSTVNVNGGEITGNTAAYDNGAGICVDDGSTVNVDGGEITGNVADYEGSAIYVNNAKFIVNSGFVSAISGDYGIITGGDSTVSINGGTVIAGASDYGGSKAAFGSAPDVADGLIVYAGKDEKSSALVANPNASTYTGNKYVRIEKAHVNHCYCGGDVDTDGHTHDTTLTWTAWDKTDSLPTAAGNYYLVKNVALTGDDSIKADINLCLNGRKITHTKPKVDGKLKIEGGKFKLSDCTKFGVITGDSRGVCVTGKNTEFTMYGGNIRGNTAGSVNYYHGGGVFAGKGAVLNINGGKISGNTAPSSSGGGVCVGENAVLNMNGGKIVDNTAESGGGGICGYGANVNINGGEISRNSAKNDGGGIDVNNATLTLEGKAKIINNAANYGGGIRLNGSSGQRSFVNLNGGEITGNTAKISGGGIYAAETVINIKDGKITGNSATAGGGILAVSTSADVEDITMSGGEISGNTAQNGGGIYTSRTTVSVTDGKISGNTANEYGGGIRTAGSTVTLGGKAKVIGNTAKYGSGISVAMESTVNVNGGEISGNIANQHGGGIYAEDYSTLYVNSGSISGNTATQSGGGIYAKGKSILYINSGEITGNKAENGGGVYTFNSTVNMPGGSISGNSASKGGGAYFEASTVTQSGGKINDNTADNGGGIYAFRTTVTANNGELSGNKATGLGGGIYIINSNTHITGGSISGNSAATGGGIYADHDANLNIDSVNITDNTAAQSGGVYVDDAVMAFEVAGALKISGNTAGTEKTPSNLFIKTLISIDIDGLSDEANIGVTAGNAPTPGNPFVIAYTYESDDSKCFFSDNDKYGVKYDDAANRIVLGAKCTVKFDANGHGTAPADITAIDGDKIEPADITAEGYTFAGWCKDKDCTIPWEFDTDTVSGDITLYANWSLNSYNITYHLNGGNLDENAPKTYTYGKALALPIPTKKGYDFVGWYEDSGATGNNITAISDTRTGDVELYAKWSANSYTVTFDSNGHGTAPADITAKYSETIAKPNDITAVGYIFGGWYKDKACDKVWNFDTDTVDGDITLYAKWSECTHDWDTQENDGWKPTSGSEDGHERICGKCKFSESGLCSKVSSNWAIEQGEHVKRCGTCKRELDRSADHKWSDWNVTKQATCTETGEREHTCEYCNTTAKETIKAAGHAKSDKLTYSLGGDTHWYTCKNCDAKLDQAKHTFDKTKVDDKYLASPATCTAPAKYYKSCECGAYTVDETFEHGDPNGHKWGEWKPISSPTCTDNGAEIRECSVCHAKESKNINPNGHDWENDYTVDKKPTCTKDGSKSIHCKNCDAVKDSKTIDALGHTFGKWKTVSAPTCTASGTEKRVCTVCDYSETRTVDANGHKWDNDYTVDKEPTCTKEGSKSIHCKNCDAVKNGKTIDALGHSFGEWATVKQPTCTEKGTKERICSVCRHKESKAVNALGHTFGEWATVKQPTCTQKGTEERTCSLCNEKQSKEIKAIGHSGGKADCIHKAVCETCGNEYGDLDPHNHSKLIRFNSNEATHLKEGNIEYWYCEGCNKYFVKDGNGYKEITESETKIPKTTDHKPNETGWNKDDEYHWYVCECGEVLNKDKHDCRHEVVNERCDKPGKEYKQCMICGYVGDEKEVAPKPHSYGNWIIIKKPTATSKGEQKRSCTVCGNEEIEELPIDNSQAVPNPPTDVGDNNILLWIILMFMGCGLFVSDRLFGRKKRKNK